MTYHPSNHLDEVIKHELKSEIIFATDFLNWIDDRIEARSLDKDRVILDILIDLKKNQEGYIDAIQQEWFKKYS